jgi:nucleoside-diphosphate-sugar epimerase
MRIAVAGTGSFAKYFIDELPRAGHDVVVLTRSHKPELDSKPGVVDQRVTDYSSADQMTPLLADCDALVSTIFDPSPAMVDKQLAMVEACKRSLKCKRFIPSEFSGNSEEHPEPPESLFYGNAVVRQALEKQSEIEWTVISLGWVAEYVLPPNNRHHREYADMFAVVHESKSMTIPGTGDELFTLTSVRDVAKAVAELVKSPNKWRHFTYVQGEQTTWHEIAKVMKTLSGWSNVKITYESVDNVMTDLARSESTESTLVLELKLLVPIGFCTFDQAKVQRDRAEFFPNVNFRSIEELVAAAKKNPAAIA